MSKFRLQKPVEHVHTYAKHLVSKYDLKDAITTDRHIPTHLRDKIYVHPTHEDWLKIFQDVCKDLPQPKKVQLEIKGELHIGHLPDCDDMALITRARVIEKYGFNALVVVEGNAVATTGNRVSHAWIWFYDELGWHQLEPRGCKVYEIDEHGYYAHSLYA